jgi:hypothetical protein
MAETGVGEICCRLISFVAAVALLARRCPVAIRPKFSASPNIRDHLVIAESHPPTVGLVTSSG